MKNKIFSSYSTYKKNEIEWLGNIPSHWEIKRIKDLSLLQSGNNIISEQIDEEGSYPVYGGNGLRGYYSNFTNDGNYILIGRQGALCGNINYASGKFWASEHAVVVYHKRYINYKWYGEILRVMNLNQYSISAAQPGLAVERIKRLLLPVPTLPEQTAIANYLDEKTALIDKKINLLTQKADKYKELKQALINETVTRGLDKNVNLKDSGVECLSAVAEIGKIPVHWEVKRAKDIFYQTRAKAGPSSSSYDVLSLTLKGVIKRDLETMVGKIPASFDTYQIAKKDNLILCLFDMDVTPRIIGYVSFEGIVTSAYTVLVSMKNTISKYYYYYYLEQNRNKSLLANSKTLRSTMTYDLFSQLQVPVPPKNEQTQIAEYLDKKTSQIDKIVESINNQIEKLKELRKTLINDVVTGKIKVTE